MAPILKDSDVLTTPEATARRGSSSTSSTESPVKAQPVALEIPITVNGARTVEGSDKREPFSESTKTVMVFGSGAVIRLTSAMAPGQLLFLTNEHTKKEVVCQVVKSKNYRNASGYVELEFTEPAVGFWGMRFPGDRIGPGPQAAQAETRTPPMGNGAPAPVRPGTPRMEQPAASDAPSVNGAKPSAPAFSNAKPPASATRSSIVPPAFDSSTALPDASKTKPNTNASPAPIATSLGADTPLVEPWLKKREPAPRVPAASPSVASAAPSSPPAKPAAPESNLTPVRSFAVERPSDKAASLFAPATAPTNLASVDLSSLAPFFEVKPASVDGPAAPPKAPVAGHPETDELKQQTARLQDELAKMQFAETASSSAAKVEAEKLESKKLEAEKPAAPEVETPAFPLTEHSFETLKAELVHENAVRLMENPEPTSAGAVLPEVSKLDEPVKIEPPATIPALETLEQGEMKIPAWLEPLARNSSAPSSTQELVVREKTKRRAEQPQLQELVAPLVTPAEEKGAVESRVPQFGSVLPFEQANTVSKSSHKKSSKGTLLGGIAAGILTLAAGGWWFMNQQSGGIHSEAAAMQAVSARPQDSQPNATKKAVLGSVVPGHADAASSQTKPAEVNSNAPSSVPSSISSPAAASSAASTARGPQGSSKALNGGRAATKAEAVEPELVQAVEKKPALGEVHLAVPKISQKRTAQTATAPDAGVLNEDQPADTADSLGGLAVASNQPAAPSAPVGVGGDVKQAKLISSIPPVYPALAKAQHVSGAVTIDALIDANGRVTTMKVISGPTLLQGAAMDALKQWKYQPATLNGNAVPMHLTVTLQFRLQQ